MFRDIVETHASCEGSVPGGDTPCPDTVATSEAGLSDWHRFNDDKVTSLGCGSLEDLKKSHWFGQPEGTARREGSAYMLLYEKVLPGDVSPGVPPGSLLIPRAAYAEFASVSLSGASAETGRGAAGC